MPAFPPHFPLIFLLELLFGLGYNQVVRWAHGRKLWHVSVSVIFGVAGTLIIPLITATDVQMQLWQFSIFYFLCFLASGMPMAVGSLARSSKKSHKRRPLPNHVLHAHEDIVTMLRGVLGRIVKKEAEVVEVVDTLHEIIGILSSLKTL